MKTQTHFFLHPHSLSTSEAGDSQLHLLKLLYVYIHTHLEFGLHFLIRLYNTLLSMRDLTRSGSVNLKERKKRSQRSSGSIIFTWFTNVKEKNNYSQASLWELPGRISDKHTDVWKAPTDHAWPGEDCCQAPAESVPTHSSVRILNLSVAVTQCWKLPAQVLDVILIWMEKPEDTAWIFHCSLCQCWNSTFHKSDRT